MEVSVRVVRRTLCDVIGESCSLHYRVLCFLINTVALKGNSKGKGRFD